MSRRNRGDEPTAPNPILIHGNDLFLRAVFAMGLHGTASGTILSDTLHAMGSSPRHVTIDDLGIALLEVDRRLRMLVQPEAATKAVAGLRHFILKWAE